MSVALPFEGLLTSTGLWEAGCVLLVISAIRLWTSKTFQALHLRYFVCRAPAYSGLLRSTILLFLTSEQFLRPTGCFQLQPFSKMERREN